MSILGAIVRTHPQHQAELQRELAALPGTEVAAAEGGRFVVVIEDSAHASAAATMTQIAALARVLNVSLVYEATDCDAHGASAEVSDFQAWRRSPSAAAAPRS